MSDTTTGAWIEACAKDDIEPEDVIRFDHDGRTYAIYRSPDDQFYATDGICTHEHAHLSDGLVMDEIIECPKHNGRFDYRTGEAKGAPVCINLKTFPVRLDGERRVGAGVSGSSPNAAMVALRPCSGVDQEIAILSGPV